MCNDLLWTDPEGTVFIMISLILMKAWKYKENVASYIDGNMAKLLLN